MKPLHIKTPLLKSSPLSSKLSKNVYLKMESMQPIFSFKIRGIGKLCQMAAERGVNHFISSSGGNAGFATAYAGRMLEKKVTVVVPESTPVFMRELIRQEKAELKITGKDWNEAHQEALSLSAGENCQLVHPFDDEIIWQGHSTIIDEIVDQGCLPDIVVVSVGGGGLLCGILKGLHQNQLSHVPVIAAETIGAASLQASLEANKHIEIDSINTIATSLGAKKIATETYCWTKRHQILSHVVSDEEALDSVCQFADDHKVLVEPACGAALAAAYEYPQILKDFKSVLFIVCGGAGVSLELIKNWRLALDK